MKARIRQYILWCARRKITNTKAKIVAITGSVGKSSTKEAVTTVLKEKYRVRANYGSLNNELGLPLAILGERNASSLLGWLWKVVKISFRTFIFDPKVEVMVLECGIDKPGDMDTILSLITPDICIITTVEEAHMQNFANHESLVHEKWKLAFGTKASGTVIANLDNPPTHNQISHVSAKLITFGLNQKADYSAQNIQYNQKGTTYTLAAENEERLITVPTIGKVQAYITLPAIITGRILNESWSEIATGLEQLIPLPGRLNLLEGIKGCYLLESSYNASPSSMKAAIEVLKNIPGKRHIAIVGDMRELGTITPEAHLEMLTILAKECDIVCTFGPNYEAALAHLPAHTKAQAAFHHFQAREAIVDFITPKLQKDDIILIKGSQNTITLEKVSIKLMAHPELAKQVLPRQYGKWKHTDRE